MNRREFAKNAIIASTALGTGTGLNAIIQNHASFDDDIPHFKKLFNGKDLTNFVDINTSEDTWYVEDRLLKCTGLPIGVMRTERQFENFILDIEWRFMEEGGNSGCFIWSDGEPYQDSPFPTGMEVQMLDPQWAAINERPVEYVQGHLFPVMGLEGTIPDNPSDISGRSKSL
ncbi:MAG: DUF1080 domain-containing protein, partial [Balneolaceae bacterium]